MFIFFAFFEVKIKSFFHSDSIWGPWRRIALCSLAKKTARKPWSKTKIHVTTYGSNGDANCHHQQPKVATHDQLAVLIVVGVLRRGDEVVRGAGREDQGVGPARRGRAAGWGCWGGRRDEGSSTPDSYNPLLSSVPVKGVLEERLGCLHS